LGRRITRPQKRGKSNALYGDAKIPGKHGEKKARTLEEYRLESSTNPETTAGEDLPFFGLASNRLCIGVEASFLFLWKRFSRAIRILNYFRNL